MSSVVAVLATSVSIEEVGGMGRLALPPQQAEAHTQAQQVAAGAALAVWIVWARVGRHRGCSIQHLDAETPQHVVAPAGNASHGIPYVHRTVAFRHASNPIRPRMRQHSINAD